MNFTLGIIFSIVSCLILFGLEQKHTHTYSNNMVGQVLQSLQRFLCLFPVIQKGNTALHISSLAGQAEVVTELVTNGANVNAQSQVKQISQCTHRT